MLFMEASRKSKVGQFDVAIFVNENIVRFNITVYTIRHWAGLLAGGVPMNEAELVDCFDGKHAFGHVEACNIFRERVVLDKHGHQVTAR